MARVVKEEVPSPAAAAPLLAAAMPLAPPLPPPPSAAMALLIAPCKVAVAPAATPDNEDFASVPSGLSLQERIARSQLDVFARNKLKQKDCSHNEMMRELPAINNFFKEHGKQPPFPVWLMIGEQSSGKSTFVQRLLDFPMNITKTGTGTRRPLFVTMVQDKDCLERQCKLAGKLVPMDSVAHHICKVNQALEEKGAFEAEALHLEVRHSQLPNMMLVDLPGLKRSQEKTDICSDGTDVRDRIASIIKDKLSSPSTKLVVMLKADEMTNNGVIEFLDRIFQTDATTRDRWVHMSVFVMNGSIIKNESYATASAMKRFLGAYQKENIYPFLQYSAPDSDLEESSLQGDFKKLSEHINSLQSKEDEAFHEYFKKMQQTDSLVDIDKHMGFKRRKRYIDELNQGDSHGEIIKHMGFKRCKRSIIEQTLAGVQAAMPEVQAALEKQRRELEGEHRVLMESLDRADPHKMQNNARKFFSECCKHVLSYIDSPDLHLLQDRPEVKQTLYEELQSVTGGPFKELRLNDFHELEPEFFERLCRSFKPSSDYHPNQKLFGGQQYERRVAFFVDALLKHVPEPTSYKDEDVKSCMGAVSDAVHQSDWDQPIRGLVQHIMCSLVHPLMNWFIKSVGTMFLRFYDIAKTDLQHSQQSNLRHLHHELSAFPSVVSCLDEVFQNMVETLLKSAAYDCSKTIEPFYSMIVPEFSENTFGVTENGSNKFHSKKEQMAREYQEELVSKKSAMAPTQRRLIANDEDTQEIKDLAFDYVLKLMQQLKTVVKLGFNCHLFQKFKKLLDQTDLGYEYAAKFEELISNDLEGGNLKERLELVKIDIRKVTEHLNTAKRFMEMKMATGED